MPDPRFFRRKGPFTLGELAEIGGATLGEGADPAVALEDVAPLDTATAADLSFLDNRKYRDALKTTRAGAVFLSPEFADDAPEGTALLLSPKPYKAYALATQAFYPEEIGTPGVHPRAVVSESAVLGAGCRIEAGAIVSAGTKLGARCAVGPNAVIAENVEIGDDCRIGACASLTHCLIGARVDIYPGVRIGQKGFGFALDPEGHEPVPQIGRVIVEDDVSIGANACIDRGAGPDTVIGRGTIIDNLAQIAHNVQVGPHCVIIAQVGISGSVKLENHVVLAGQVGIAGHLKIGAGAQIGAQSGILKDVATGEKMFGSPAFPARERMRHLALLQKLARGKGR